MDTTQQDYELLSRYLDGELPPPLARELEQRLAAEPALGSVLARMRALQGQLHHAYEGIANQPVPQRILALLQAPQANVVPIGHKRALNRPRKRVMNWGFALAASLLVAVSATMLTRLEQQSAQPGAAGVDNLLSLAL
ncbi:MAG: anti-sigma factor family protein, partial [Halioglobus sp.]